MVAERHPGRVVGAEDHQIGLPAGDEGSGDVAQPDRRRAADGRDLERLVRPQRPRPVDRRVPGQAGQQSRRAEHVDPVAGVVRVAAEREPPAGPQERHMPSGPRQAWPRRR